MFVYRTALKLKVDFYVMRDWRGSGKRADIFRRCIDDAFIAFDIGKVSKGLNAASCCAGANGNYCVRVFAYVMYGDIGSSNYA